MEHLTKGSLAIKEKQVIEIKASQEKEIRKVRVAAYARVSSDSTDQLNSFIAQTNHYTTLIASKENWTLADIYTDEGITGTSAEKRPDFQRLISDCRKGLVDRVLVKSISRFARNAKECLETVRELRSYGVSVLFEEQGIDTAKMSGELLTAIFASIAQSESESISGNMRWSYQRRMANGSFITNSAPFGYRLKKGKLEVFEPEAKIVKMIFEMYLAGHNRTEIAEQVNALGVPTKGGRGKWKHSAIAYILRNEKYIGNTWLQKRYTTDTLPYRRKPNQGELDQYYLYGSHPPIIEQDTFDKVAVLLRKRAAEVSCRRGDETPLTQKIVCGICGAKFRRTICRGITYWVCRSHYESKNACSMPRISEKEIHAAFLRLYHKLALHGEPILKQMVSNLQTIRERRMLWSLDIIELNKRISDLMDQDRMLADMNRNGFVDPDIFISQSNELARQIRSAKQEKERLIGSEHDDTIQKTRELLENLGFMPEYLAEFDGEVFSDLVEQITSMGDGQLRFKLRNGVEITERIERKVQK